MKRFLPLFILTGLLFGQDVLILKSGEYFEGAFYGKVGEDIVFKIEGETSTKKFPIWSVETIVTKNGELTYPFDIPRKDLSKQDVLLHKSGKNYKGTFLGKVDEKIIFKIEGEKSNSAFSINDVNTIVTKNGELTYPFGILTNKIRKLPEGVGGLICIGSCYMIMQLYAWWDVTGNKGKGHRS